MIFNTQYLINTAPSATRCHQCHTVTLSGIDCGMPYKVDAFPLTLEGELHARRAGRLIYWLVAGHVAYRETPHVRGGRDLPVLAAHRCAPIDPTHIAARHIPELLRLTAPPTTAEPWPTQLEFDPATNTLRPVPVADPPAPF